MPPLKEVASLYRPGIQLESEKDCTRGPFKPGDFLVNELFKVETKVCQMIEGYSYYLGEAYEQNHSNHMLVRDFGDPEPYVYRVWSWHCRLATEEEIAQEMARWVARRMKA